MNPLILIAEDDADIRGLLKLYLEGEGFRVLEADNGARALDLARAQAPDMAILDIMMPQLNGFELTRALRKFSDIPILILSAKSQDNDKILGLNLGADDYITKPFSMRELLARVKANIRRVGMLTDPAQIRPSAASRLEQGRIAIDTELLMAYKDGAPLELTQREYELLKFLASNPGKVFSREALMENVWNYEGYVGDVRAVDVAVRRLREKVEDDPASPQFIITRRGLGYLFHSGE